MTALQARFEVRAGSFELSVDLELAGGVLVLFGPSGAGKSLTVAALAGLVRPHSGRIELAGRLVFDSEQRLHVPARRRRVGYVPQHNALFPFADVAANVAFGLPRAQRRADSPRVRLLLEELELSDLASALPESLSGGERQRVALARALAPAPDLLLLDEPFASIDRDGRRRIRATLAETLERHGTPAVFVTHSEVEALELGDRLVLFERGRTAASGSPAELLAGGAWLEGRVSEAGPGEAGRARVELRDAVVEGPAELLEPGADGRIRLPVGPAD